MTDTPEKLDLSTKPLERDAGRIPALDGVRGLAIAMVMFFHLTVLWKGNRLDAIYGAVTRLGWVGVDLFFVLSGFLITGILLSSRGQKRFFSSFYMRRVLRIFPLYYLVILFATVILPLTPLTQMANFQSVNHGEWNFPFGLKAYWPHWPFYWLYFANIPIVFTRDFNNDFIGITWSLAIEEQFYMIWPLVVLYCTPAQLKKVCVGVLSFSFLCRVAVAVYIHFYGNAADNHRMAYEFTFSRLDAISLGSLLATINYVGGIDAVRALIPRTLLFAPISLLLILVSIVLAKKPIFHEHWFGSTIGYTAIAIFFFCLLIWTITSSPSGFFNRFFTQGWLRFLGKYSYAIYLCHMPIHTIVREKIYRPEDFPQIGGTYMLGQIIFYVICTVPTLIVALLSWNLIEKHFLSLKKYFPSHHPKPQASAAEQPAAAS